MADRKATFPINRPALAALTELDRSLLVEAGAGSGKTSIMAGRVAMLLAARRRAKAYRRHHFHRVRGQRTDDPHRAVSSATWRMERSRGS